MRSYKASTRHHEFHFPPAPGSTGEAFLGRVAARRRSDPDISISLGAHGAIFFSSPSLPPDVPRTPGTRWMESQRGVHGTSGRRNPCTVPWTSVPWTYSHSVNTSGSRVLRLRRSTRSKASRRSIMLLQVLRRLDRLRFPCRIIHSIGVVVPHRNLPERRLEQLLPLTGDPCLR
jgi:hypothetical protein